MSRFRDQQEVRLPPKPSGWVLCLQWGYYDHGGGHHEDGYRFIWRRSNGSIQPRGPARIPSLDDVDVLVRMARNAGWGANQGP